MTYTAPVGRLTLMCAENSLTGLLWIEGQKYFGGSGGIGQGVAEKENAPVLLQARKWLDQYFAGKNPQTSALPLRPFGSAFQQLVWKMLCTIPYGQTITYGELARKAALEMGKATMSAQAIGGAVSRNPISILIPCHRVIGADGSLIGYAGGLDKKLFLLKLEAS